VLIGGGWVAAARRHYVESSPSLVDFSVTRDLYKEMLLTGSYKLKNGSFKFMGLSQLLQSFANLRWM